MLRFLRYLVSFAFLTPIAFHAHALTLDAPISFMVDLGTDTVVIEQQADQVFPPANMTKLMSLAIVFQALEDGDIDRSDLVRISEKAWREGGAPSGRTTMFAKLNSLISIDDLVKASVVQHANDAIIAIAEHIAVSELDFVSQMNDYAASIGLKDTRYVSSSGRADASGDLGATTARDVERLVRHIFEKYPDHVDVFIEPAFEWNRIFQRNKTPLLGKVDGMIGGYSAFVDALGHGLVSIVDRQGRQVIVVAHGYDTKGRRDLSVQNVLQTFFQQYKPLSYMASGDVVGKGFVFGGAEASTQMVLRDDLHLSFDPERLKSLHVSYHYQRPLIAPVSQGTVVGELRVLEGRRIVKRAPLIAGHDVALGSLHQRAVDGLVTLVFDPVIRWFGSLVEPYFRRGTEQS